MVELIMVVALIGLAAAMAIPNIGEGIAKTRVKRAARDLLSNMQWAKSSAVRYNQVWAVKFDPVNGKYEVFADWDQDNNNGTLRKTVLLSSYGSDIKYGHGDADKAATKAGGDLPDDDVSFAGNTAIFTVRGMASRLGYVYVDNEKKKSYAVGVQSLAGSIVVKEWLSGQWYY